METENLISIQQVCIYHDINDSFINSLNEFGLIEIIIVDQNKYIHTTQLRELEKMIRMHYELEINIEGIDTIRGLLETIKELQNQLTIAKNRLKLYED
jgi:hypothetical protein